mmetsp:Transcript_127699/g.232203  ORF Transcript_127699/g.232203 Transcript_127699/m.232203 type:complete len:205 (-) Transcript_127699:1041-1655(-)
MLLSFASSRQHVRKLFWRYFSEIPLLFWLLPRSHITFSSQRFHTIHGFCSLCCGFLLLCLLLGRRDFSKPPCLFGCLCLSGCFLLRFLLCFRSCFRFCFHSCVHLSCELFFIVGFFSQLLCLLIQLWLSQPLRLFQMRLPLLWPSQLLWLRQGLPPLPLRLFWPQLLRHPKPSRRPQPSQPHPPPPWRLSPPSRRLPRLQRPVL